MFKFLLLTTFIAFFGAGASAQNAAAPPLLINRVAHNQTQVAFTFAGKIWLVPKTGGAARLLTKTAHEETNPVFSPDGSRLAFSRLNGGDWDVYVMPADGGAEAKRVTLMPESDLMAAWTPDGKEVVFQTTRDEENVFRFYKMNAANPTLAAALPLPQSLDGAFSPDGRRIAYTPRRFIFGEWRYYRGGMTSPIWITDLATGATEKLPNQNFNDRNPMWLGDKIYFLSDRAGTFNLFSYDLKTKQTKELTKFDGQGIRHACAFGGEISFVRDGRLHLFDTATGADKIVGVTVAPDTSELLPRTVNAFRFVESLLPSQTGEKIAFGARGEVLIFDAKTGEYKNLTNTSGAAERYPVISPDGKRVAYFSDESGEYQLHLRSLDTGAVEKIAIEPKPSFYWNLAWSPDSRKLVFNDRRLNLWLMDTQSGAPVKIDASDYSAQDNWAASFSPDSRYLTYAKRLKNRAGTVFVYDPAQKKSFQITDGKTHAQTPVFDANGKYLYFVSSPNALTSEFEWGVLNGVFARPLIVRKVHALILDKNAPAPFLPGRQPNPDAKAAESAAQIRIDFENLEDRFVDLPLPARDYNRLASGAAGKLFLVVDEWTATPGDFNEQTQTQALYGFDAAKPNGLEKIVGDVGGVDLTGDGGKILYRKGRDYFLTGAGGAVKEGDGRQDFGKMEIKINPAEEWRQIFHESVRLMRDWFYDPNLHGQNLNALENHYAAYLPTTTRRADLNALIGRMLGSVSVSHFGVGGGDAPPPFGRGGGIGLLGADYAIENDRYRFKKIYRSTSYSSVNGRFGAPLAAPGVDVREGDYLLEVNGAKIDAAQNILSYFENTAGKPTVITVSANPDGSGARSFTVYPANGENRLRRANWAENNRRLVEKLSGGKLGYIFIENYDGDGIMNAVRGLTASAGKAGVIIDQRFNGGGITPDYLIEWLNRKPLYNYAFRGGDEIATPVNPAPPVKVLIVNEWNGSAAETGAFMFKLGKVGTIVGKRTSGGGIGPYFFTPRFVDGGRVQIPNRAAFNPDGKSWGIENAGVEPDIDVEIMPQDFIAGKDAQLEKAVEAALTQIAKNPFAPAKRPLFPVHPGAQETTAAQTGSILPIPGSAFPLPAPKPAAGVVTNGKFAEFLGQFDTPMGVITFTQEGEKLIGLAGGERIELFPEAGAKDKFAAQSASVTVAFERDATGKVTGAVVVIPSGRELKGKKIN
ncbi:MAG TPA: PDZ domain-containing protein [Pyrinomonadaceae bacterium]|jgi:tricorn protease